MLICVYVRVLYIYNIYIYIYIGYSGEKTTPLSKKYFDMMSSKFIYIYGMVLLYSMKEKVSSVILLWIRYISFQLMEI